MPLELFAAYLKLPVFALVASRIAGVVMFLPMVGGLAIPPVIRGLLVIGLAAIASPFVQLEAPPASLAALVLGAGGELLLGVLIGLVLRTLFVGLELAGQLVAQESGLAFGQIADPNTGDDQTVLSGLYVQLAGVVFLLVGGHRLVLAAVLDTFARIPLLSQPPWELVGLDPLMDMFAVAGAMAIRIGAPALITLFLVNVALGFVARTVPQLNVTMVGFSIKGLVAFLIMALSLPAAMDVFIEAVDDAGGLVFAFARYG